MENREFSRELLQTKNILAHRLLLARRGIGLLEDTDKVVGVGLSTYCRGEIGVQYTESERDVIVVFVEDQETERLLPERYRGYRIVPVVSGKITLRETETIGDVYSYRLERHTTLIGGIAIGHYQGGSGTLGCIVYDRDTGRPLILSNNHVCFDEDTEILTETGWKKINTVTLHEKVATLNHRHEIEMQYPTAIEEVHYSGTMIKITNTDIDLLVTPDHRLYIKTDTEYRIVTAIQLYIELTTRRNKAHMLTVKRGEIQETEITHRDIELVTYTGKVYDVTVPNGLIIVRRNKKTAITGNCALQWGSCRVGKIGDPILQPGPVELSDTCCYRQPTDCPPYRCIDYRHYLCGRLYRYIPVYLDKVNLVDAALATVQDREYRHEIYGIGDYTNPPKIDKTIIGKTAIKSGRTTGITRGKIRSIHVTMKVRGWGEATFDEQIITDYMSEPGDSGSIGLIDEPLPDKKRRAFGLLFAGNETLTAYNRADIVMSKLSILFDREKTRKTQRTPPQTPQTPLTQPKTTQTTSPTARDKIRATAIATATTLITLIGTAELLEKQFKK